MNFNCYLGEKVASDVKDHLSRFTDVLQRFGNPQYME